jgi:hypothetical protein
MMKLLNNVILGLDPRIQATFSPPLDSRLRGNDKIIKKSL